MRNPFRSIAMHQRVVVNLTSGRAFRGVLFEVRGPLLVLRNAELLEGDQVFPVDGSVVVERAQVEFVQVVNS